MRQNRVAWAKLMRLGMLELRLEPVVFWALTPAELMLMAGGEADIALSRAGFAELSALFPDGE